MSKHVFYRHLRIVQDVDFDSESVQLNPKGGLTLRFEETRNDKGSQYKVSFAVVSDNDLYCKRIGREITDGRSPVMEFFFEKDSRPKLFDAFVNELQSNQDIALRSEALRKIEEIEESHDTLRILEAVKQLGDSIKVVEMNQLSDMCSTSHAHH